MNATLSAASYSLDDMPGFADVGEIVAGASSDAAPVLTGALAGSMTSTREGGKNTATITSPLVYAVPIHWGRPAHNIRANPFVMKAADETEDRQVSALEHDAQRILNKVRGV